MMSDLNRPFEVTANGDYRSFGELIHRHAVAGVILDRASRLGELEQYTRQAAGRRVEKASSGPIMRLCDARCARLQRLDCDSRPVGDPRRVSLVLRHYRGRLVLGEFDVTLGQLTVGAIDGHALAPIVAVALGTNARRGEVLGLR